MLHHFFLVQDEVHHLLFLQLHELEQERVPVCVDMVDVGSALDQAPGQLGVEVAGEHHVHQDGATVLVLLIDAVGVEQHEHVQRLLVIVLRSEHGRGKTLAIFYPDLIFRLCLVEDHREHFLVLTADGQEDGRAILRLVCAIMEGHRAVVEKELDAVLLIIENGKVERAQRVKVEKVDVCTCLNQGCQLD